MSFSIHRRAAFKAIVVAIGILVYQHLLSILPH